MKWLKLIMPRNVRRIYWILLVIGLVTVEIGAYRNMAALTWLGAALVVAGFIYYGVFNRCPHCCGFLHRCGGEYCPYCGEKVNLYDDDGEN